jgi:hypothetical protein
MRHSCRAVTPAPTEAVPYRPQCESFPPAVDHLNNRVLKIETGALERAKIDSQMQSDRYVTKEEADDKYVTREELREAINHTTSATPSK